MAQYKWSQQYQDDLMDNSRNQLSRHRNEQTKAVESEKQRKGILKWKSDSHLESSLDSTESMDRNRHDDDGFCSDLSQVQRLSDSSSSGVVVGIQPAIRQRVYQQPIHCTSFQEPYEPRNVRDVLSHSCDMLDVNSLQTNRYQSMPSRNSAFSHRPSGYNNRNSARQPGDSTRSSGYRLEDSKRSRVRQPDDRLSQPAGFRYGQSYIHNTDSTTNYSQFGSRARTSQDEESSRANYSRLQPVECAMPSVPTGYSHQKPDAQHKTSHYPKSILSDHRLSSGNYQHVTTAPDSQPSTLCHHKSLKSGYQQPTTAVHKQSMTAFHKPTASYKQQPMTTFHRAPPKSTNHQHTTSIHRQLMTSVQHQPMTSAQYQPMTSVHHQNITSGQHQPKTSVQHQPMTLTHQSIRPINQQNSTSCYQLSTTSFPKQPKSSDHQRQSSGAEIRSSANHSRGESHVADNSRCNTTVHGMNMSRSYNDISVRYGLDSAQRDARSSLKSIEDSTSKLLMKVRAILHDMSEEQGKPADRDSIHETSRLDYTGSHSASAEVSRILEKSTRDVIIEGREATEIPHEYENDGVLREYLHQDNQKTTKTEPKQIHSYPTYHNLSDLEPNNTSFITQAKPPDSCGPRQAQQQFVTTQHDERDLIPKAGHDYENVDVFDHDNPSAFMGKHNYENFPPAIPNDQSIRQPMMKELLTMAMPDYFAKQLAEDDTKFLAKSFHSLPRNFRTHRDAPASALPAYHIRNQQPLLGSSPPKFQLRAKAPRQFGKSSDIVSLMTGGARPERYRQINKPGSNVQPNNSRVDSTQTNTQYTWQPASNNRAASTDLLNRYSGWTSQENRYSQQPHGQRAYNSQRVDAHPVATHHRLPPDGESHISTPALSSSAQSVSNDHTTSVLV